MLNIGIIGTGKRALAFADYIQRHSYTNLTMICDKDYSRMQVFLEMAGLREKPIRLYTDYRELLGDPELQAVIVVTPDYTHAAISAAAMRASKHVLCDKPPAIKLEEVNQLLTILELAPEVVFVTDFVLRHHAFYTALFHSINKVGNVRHIQISDYMQGGFYFRRWHRFRRNVGGIVLHEGIHSLDIIQQIIEWQSARVSAFGRLHTFRPIQGAASVCRACELTTGCPGYFDYQTDPLRRLYETPSQQEGYPRDICIYNSESDIPDSVIANVELEKGELLSYTLCLYAPFQTRQFRLIGDAGMLICDEASRIIIYHSPMGETTKEYISVPKAKYGGGDWGVFDEFVHNALFGHSDLTSTMKGMSSTALALAIEESLNTGSAVMVKRHSNSYFFDG